MTSPEYGPKYRQLEFPVIVNGNFYGKDFLDLSLLDKPSVEKLHSVTKGLEGFLAEGNTPLLLSGTVVASVFEYGMTSTRLALESAVTKLGGTVLYQTLPEIDDTRFDYRILDIAASCPDAIVIESSQQKVFRTASVLRMVSNHPPLIDAVAVRSVNSAQGMALLALVSGKIN